jgi:hypothetical protein
MLRENFGDKAGKREKGKGESRGWRGGLADAETETEVRSKRGRRT